MIGMLECSDAEAHIFVKIKHAALGWMQVMSTLKSSYKAGKEY